MGVHGIEGGTLKSVAIGVAALTVIGGAAAGIASVAPPK
jgi:hypothetical protein